jgi:hypothetical protein
MSRSWRGLVSRYAESVRNPGARASTRAFAYGDKQRARTPALREITFLFYNLLPRTCLAAVLIVVQALAVQPVRAGGGTVRDTSTRAAVEAALRRRLSRAYLSYQWVLCVKMDRVYHGLRVWRCNVDFGDPHIVQYCVILRGRTLITDRENRALNCSPPRSRHRGSPRS